MHCFTKVTFLPLDTCCWIRVSAIRMSGCDGGHKSRGLGPIYFPASHPRSVTPYSTPSLSLSSAPPRELRHLQRATAEFPHRRWLFLPKQFTKNTHSIAGSNLRLPSWIPDLLPATLLKLRRKIPLYSNLPKARIPQWRIHIQRTSHPRLKRRWRE
jgi:hypothetical protein